MRRLLLTLAMSCAVVPWSAEAEPLSIISYGDQPQAGWVAFKLGSDGSNLRLELAIEGVATPNFLEIYKYDAQDRFIGGFGVGSIKREAGVHVDVSPNGETIVSHDETFAPGFDVMEWSPDVGTLEGVTKLLVWSSGPQDGWSWRLLGGPGISVDGFTYGSGSWALMSHDLAGLADVRAHETAFGIYGGRASVDRSRTVIAADHLIGFYVGGNSIPPITNNVLTIDGPNGEELCYPGCSFPDVVGGYGVGSYTFRLRAGMGSVWTGNDDVLAVLVDASLPS